MSKNLSSSVQKESAKVPVSGKSKKGSSESCQGKVATIEQNSCSEKKVSFSDMVEKCVYNAFCQTSKYDLFKAMDSYERDVIDNFICFAQNKLKDLLITLRTERNEKVEYLIKTNQVVKYDYRKLPSYKFVRAFRERLAKGSSETENFAFGYSSTSEGIQKNSKHLISFETNNAILQYRFTNSLLMLKKKEKDAKLAELKAVCESWIAIGLTRVQAVEMNKTLNNPTLVSYIEYLDLLATESKTDSDESKED